MKLKNIRIRIRIWVLEFDQPQWQKPYAEFNKPKIIEADKHGYKDGKALYKLMNNAVCGKTMENVRNRIDIKLESNKKDYLKWTSKPTHMLKKWFSQMIDLV